MANEIKEEDDKIVKKISDEIEYFRYAFDDGETSDPKEYEDDNTIHISRGKHRFCFSNGHDEGCLTEKDVSKYADMVDAVLGELRKSAYQKTMIKNMSHKKIDDLSANEVLLFFDWLKIHHPNYIEGTYMDYLREEDNEVTNNV